MIEQEIWGKLTKEQFDSLLAEAKVDFADYTYKTRFAVSFWDPKYNKDLDTRIRITNGVPEIMQKSGTWENTNQVTMEEVSLKIEPNLEAIYSLYRILDRSQPPANRHFTKYYNHVFITTDFELKFSEQVGNSTKYSFELELLNDALNLQKLADEMGLAQYNTQTDVSFWEQWNKEANKSSENMTVDEIKDFFAEALNLQTK